MSTASINGGNRLSGTVRVSGAKNSALRLLCGTLLTDEPCELLNMPTVLSDITVLCGMLKLLGKNVDVRPLNNFIVTGELNKSYLKWDGRSIRNSLLVLGCVLARTGEGCVPLPGGCKLGERKYDLHIHIMEKFGGEVWEDEQYLYAKMIKPLAGAEIYLPIRSTGATEHGILMAVLAKGKSTIWNPHIRPEIMDLIAMLNEMGARIVVNGQESIVIDGVNKLSGVQHRCIPDNMEALTWMIASAVTDGEIEIEDFPITHLEVPLIFLRESGLRYYVSQDQNRLIVKNSHPYPLEFSTGPYPGINSDMQPIMAVFAALARGESRIIDLRFPGRYQYARELKKFGIEYEIRGDLLKIFGNGGALNAAITTALDLRAGAAVCLCALAAGGKSVIQNFEQVERGYDRFIEKAVALGAEVHVERQDDD